MCLWLGNDHLSGKYLFTKKRPFFKNFYMKTIFLKCIFSKPFFASIYLSLNGSMWLRPRKNYFSEFSEALKAAGSDRACLVAFNPQMHLSRGHLSLKRNISIENKKNTWKKFILNGKVSFTTFRKLCTSMKSQMK